MIYTFTGFAKEIFDYFSKDATVEDFFLHTEKEYEIDINDNEFKNGIIEFLETLLQSVAFILTYAKLTPNDAESCAELN